MRSLSLLAVLTVVMSGLAPPAEAGPRRAVTLTASTARPEVSTPVTLSARVVGLRQTKRVVVQRRVSSGWRAVRSERTTSSRVSVQHTPATVGRLTLRAVAIDSVRRVVSPAVTIQVVPSRSVTLRASVSAAPVDTTIVLSGRLDSADGTSDVSIEQRDDRGWSEVADLQTTSSGAYSLHTTLAHSTTFRAHAVAAPGRTAAVSATIAVEAERHVGGTITEDTTWDAGSPTVLLSSDLVVADGATLTIAPGVRVLAGGRSITVHGRLVAGQGGVTELRHDESPSQRPGSWPGIVVAGDGKAELGRSAISGAGTAIAAATGSHVSWHGSIRESTHGVTASSFVDASDVDWGTSSGPAPYGTGPDVTWGAVRVVPWRDYSVPTGDVTVPAQAEPECTDVRFLGVRGSGEPPQGEDYTQDNAQGMGLFGFFTALDAGGRLQAASPGLTWSHTGIRYSAAELTGPGGWAGWSDSLREGASGVESSVRAVGRACPDTSVVLIGTSQGAGVIRLGLQGLSDEDRDRVAGVVLWGDYSRPVGSAEVVMGAGGQLLGRDPGSSRGLVQLSEMVAGASDELPSDVASRTLSVCREDDVICTAVPGATVEGHVGYDADDVRAAARWLADQVQRRRDPS